MTTEDRSLADPTPAEQSTPAGSASSTVFHQPPLPEPINLVEQLTIDQILDMAKLPERRARICLRGDLQARYDQIVAELGQLVTPSGELISDPETSLGEQTTESRAQALADELESVRAEMAGAMVSFLFRGMSADDLAVFEKAHKPKDPKADHTDYWVRLIAASSVEPEMTQASVQAFRKKFGANAFWELVTTARDVNMGGGVDVPKSLNFSQVRPGS